MNRAPTTRWEPIRSIAPWTLSERSQTIGCVLVLLALNAYICRELFAMEYTQHMGSIEAAYIAISRYVLQHPWDLTWFPWWFGGIPYQNSYPPFLHVLVAAGAALTGVSPALSYHAVTAAMYSLGPVALFWLAYRFSGERWVSFGAALLYSVISPSTFLIPSIAGDVGSLFGPRRLHALVHYGDGPHIASLTLLPLALLALHGALHRRTPSRVYGAGFLLALLALTNWIGALALAVAVFSYLLTRGDRVEPRAWFIAAGIALLAYLLASPWLPPSTVADIRRNSGHIGGSFPMTLEQLLYGTLLLAIVLLLRMGLRRWGAPRFFQFSLLFLVMTAAVPLSWEWLGIYLVPQPSRYHLEMEMAFCLAFAAGLALAVPRLRRGRSVWWVAACLLFIAFIALQTRSYRLYARDLIQPIEIESTIEYQAARWLDENLPGQRVFASGSVQFWLNAFANNSQIGGGFGPGVSNSQIPVVEFGLTFTEGDGPMSAMWLRTYGAKAIVVGGPNSREVYKPYRDPTKFDGVLPELWRSGDDVIYAVPQRSTSLAHVIERQHVVPRAPINNVDVEPVRAYAKALESPDLPLAELTWQSRHEVVIVAELGPEQLLSVQISHDPGWRATVNGEPRRIERDPLGWMLVEPRCAGPCRVELIYDGGLEMILAKLSSGVALLGGLVWFCVDWRRAKRSSQAS